MKYLVYYQDYHDHESKRNIIINDEQELKDFMEQTELKTYLNEMVEKIRNGYKLAVGEEGPLAIQSKINSLVIFNIIALPY